MEMQWRIQGGVNMVASHPLPSWTISFFYVEGSFQTYLMNFMNLLAVNPIQPPPYLISISATEMSVGEMKVEFEGENDGRFKK